MGVINLGILGGFSGKVGTVVGASWKGISYMRAKAQKVSNPRSSGQVNQREKLKAVALILRSMVPYLRASYAAEAKKMSAYNAAAHAMLLHSVSGDYPAIEIDYSHAPFATGRLEGAAGATTTATTGKVTFSWTDNSNVDDALGTDYAMPLLYNETKQRSVFGIKAATRQSATSELTVPSTWKGDTVHAYLAFRSADGKATSESTYIGTVSIV
jgi:hypothetical protein